MRLEDEARTEIAWAVKNRRQELGLTQREVAERAGRSDKWISQIECGRRDPYLSTVLRVAEALETDLCGLLG